LDAFYGATDETAHGVARLLERRKEPRPAPRVPSAARRLASIAALFERHARTPSHGVRIDMTPMVDVAFLLLIFFMSTTQFKPAEQVSVHLPSSSSEIHVPEHDTIILTVNREGRLFISSELGWTRRRLFPAVRSPRS
jgi:hypothetical protein